MEAIQTLQSRTNSGVARTLIFFSLAMLTVPVFSYFFSRSVIFIGILGTTSKDSYFYAAIVAVVIVHIILAGFVYVALTEDRQVAKTE